MKKLFFILILFIVVAIKVQANSDFIPRWDEFCPAKYVNAEQMEYKKMPAWRTFLYTVSIIGYSYILSDRSAVNKNNYWVNRRNSFKNEIGLCSESESSDSTISCYMKVRQLEIEKNHQLVEEQIEEQQLQVARERLYTEQRKVDELRRLNNKS